MFTEKEINELIWTIVLKHEKLNTKIISTAIQEMLHIQTLSVNSINTYTLKLNALNEAISNVAKSVLNDINKLIFTAGSDIYFDTKYLYEYRGMKFPKFSNNDEVLHQVDYIASTLKAEYSSVMNKTGLLVQQNGIWIPKNFSDAYMLLMNKAKESVLFGTEINPDYYIKSLADNGLRFLSPSYDLITSYALDSYLDTKLANGVRDVQTGVMNEVAVQVKSNGVELSAHIFPAPDHAPVQGRQFEISEFEKMQNGLSFTDVKGNHYEGFKRPIGAWNCRHITKSIIIGISDPQYTEKELKQLLERNEKGYTMRNGRHYTMYECTQYQRKMEREIRKYNTMLKVAKSIGDKELEKKYSNLARTKIVEYKLFSQKVGLSSQFYRLEV